MKMITQTISQAQFKALLQKDAPTFRSHISRTAAQFREQEYLKENLPPNHSTFIWILPKIIGAHRKMRSSLPIGHQLRSLSILLLCTIKRRIQKKAVTKALCLFRMSPVMTQYLPTQ